MKENNCCICEEEVKSPYWSIQHLGNGKSRIYKGHKRCLNLLESKITAGVEIPYEEIDTAK